MKIALLTIWHVGNYGAELQAYATVRKLTEMGHEVEIIDIRENEHDNPSLKSKVAQIISHMTPAYNRFYSFWSKNFPNKTRHYRNISELKDNPPTADAFLVGSDQTWNPDITAEKVLTFFLDFVPEGVRRISYAPSFGKSQWTHDSHITEQIRMLLNKFDRISCRESSGVRILEDTFKLSAECVLDPTLLLENYDDLTGPLKARKQLAYYPLVRYPELRDFAGRIAGEMGLSTIDSNKTVVLTHSIPWKRPSVSSWIRSIAESEFVITPSFHGLAFSLIYKRPFMIVNKGGNASRSARMVDLLRTLGLSERYFETFEEAWTSKIWTKPIDYDRVSAKLDCLRADSINFLNEALQ